MGKDNPEAAYDWGYCAAQGLYNYYGCKLHAVCGIRGIHSYDMAAESVHALHCLKDVQMEYCDCMMLGDKGYLGM